MGSEKLFEYTPDYAVLPGITIQETINALGISQAELANRMGRPKKTINEIIKGKASVSPETALQLERVLGISATFWNNLERNYQEALAAEHERKGLEADIAWLKSFPIKTLISLGIVSEVDDKVRQIQEILSFFGVSSRMIWESIWLAPEGVFRKSSAFIASPYSVATWLRLGELAAQRIDCAPYDRNRFRMALRQIRNLTIEPPDSFHPQMVQLCAESGVAVVFIPELPKIRASGYTRWLNPRKALIQLSLRYKTDDQLWFTFFHEAGHILLHGKKDVFIEEEGASGGDLKEEEANRFAANSLIPKHDLRLFMKTGKVSKAAIRKFAKVQGIAPGIIVGRLQHEEYLPYSHCNDLKKYIEWK